MSPFKYTERFVENLASARKVVPLLLESIEGPRSVVDLGGGTGAWCKVFRENGVPRVRCIDDARIAASDLLVAPDEFLGCNMAETLPEPIPSDLAVSLEAAEHIPTDMSGRVVDFLTRSADLVLFSAAIPGQPHAGHINEQPPTFWKRLFQQRGFQRLDILRPRIIGDPDVSHWYRQNLFLFANERGLGRVKRRAAPFDSIPDDFELVHESVLRGYRDRLRPPSVRRAFRELMRAVGSRLRRRLAGNGIPP